MVWHLKPLNGFAKVALQVNGPHQYLWARVLHSGSNTVWGESRCRAPFEICMLLLAKSIQSLNICIKWKSFSPSLILSSSSFGVMEYGVWVRFILFNKIRLCRDEYKFCRLSICVIEKPKRCYSLLIELNDTHSLTHSHLSDSRWRQNIDLAFFTSIKTQWLLFRLWSLKMAFIDIDAVFNARLDNINLILFSEYGNSILEFIWNKYIHGPWTQN